MQKPVLPSLAFFQRLKKIFYPPSNPKEQLIRALDIAEENHLINSFSRSIIDGAIQAENLVVRDVMVPKSKMVLIQHDASVEDFLAVITNSPHSRFPVLTSHKDKVQGIILAKDLLGYLARGNKEAFHYQEYLRTAILVPESKTLDTLLQEFQQKKSHIAVVMDEYGEIAGLITLEDVLEQIVGEIEDESDLEEDNIIDFGEGRYLLRALTPLEEFNAFFEVQLSAHNSDTIAGLVIAKFTYLPSQMSEISIQGFHFKVLKTDSKRLHLLEVTRENERA